MRRVGYVFLTCLLVFSVGSFAYSGTEIMQDNSGVYSPGAITNQAISDGSIVREVFAGVTPADEEAFINDSATRVFTPGQAVNLYARYALDLQRTYTMYWIVANGGGQIAFFDSFNATDAPGGYFARNLNVSLDPGTYLLHAVILGDGITVMSPNPFVFVVE